MASRPVLPILCLAASALCAVAAAQAPTAGSGAASAGKIAPSPFVGAWAHTEPATRNSSAMVAFLAIMPDGTWSEKLEIAARGKLVPTVAIAEGRCSIAGADSIICTSLHAARSRDGTSWTPTKPQPPTFVQLRGKQLISGGWLFHRSQ